MKDASPRQILELPIPVILLDNKEIRETEAPYPDDV
jgi:hypothetical protein